MKQFLSILFVSCISLFSYAQWSNDPAVADTKVFMGADNQANSQTVSDGSGGAIVFWESYASSANSIHYNHLSSSGVATWAPVTTGLQLSTGTGDNSLGHVISDGSGGAFVSWEDEETGIVSKVQHISSTGTKLWAAGGVALSSNSFSSFICSDGSGGVIACWQDDQYDPVNDFPRSYAQRVSSAGTALWTSGGVRILNTADFDAPFGVVPDGAGGAIFLLLDARNNTYDPVADESDNIDVFAQRMNASGTAVWASAGVPVCTTSNNQSSAARGQHNYIVTDGAGGAILAWEDYRDDPNNGNADPYNGDIYAQRLNAAGAAQWTANGVAVCNASNDQYTVSMIPDGANGAILSWMDERTAYDLFAQKINGSGTPQWVANGKSVVSLADDFDYNVSADETGNYLMVAWGDYTSQADIYAQKIAVSDGSFLWGANGTLVCGRTDEQREPAITHNGSGGAIITWTDSRNADNDIYANRVLSNGSLPLTFIDFSATLKTNAVSLLWSTGTEINTKQYNIQRSFNGTDFITIGTIPAAGNSNTLRNYSYEDLQGISLKGKTLYYRIHETDMNGQSFYTAVKNVKIPGYAAKFSLAFNPVHNEALINYESDEMNVVRIKVIDDMGRIIFTTQTKVTAGINKINLPVTSLSKGIYTIQLSGNKINGFIRMMKD